MPARPWRRSRSGRCHTLGCWVRGAPGPGQRSAEAARPRLSRPLPRRRRARSGERVAYVNPPRSGLEAELLVGLADELKPARMAYLSCSAGTLARDLAGFEACGHTVDRLVPYDFFPGTHHVECLALLHLAQAAFAAAGPATLR